MALSRERPAGSASVRPVPRPAGTLIWLHLPLYEGSGAIRTLLARAREELGVLNALVTFDKASPNADTGEDEEIPPFLLRPAPAESQVDTAGFLRHWRPDLLIWVGGPFRPVLLSEVDALDIPRVLVNAEADSLGSITGTWVPGMTRALIGPFRHVITHDDEAAQRLSRMGLEIGRIEVAGQLDEDPEPLPCDDSRRMQTAEIIGPRPVCMAAEVPLEEVVTVKSAFRTAQRRAHRLLMVLDPASRRDGAAIRDSLAATGLRTVLRSAGEEIDSNTEIVVADLGSEQGLWLRIASVTYLGGTISGAGCMHPYLPASVGSAIIHGPRIGAREVAINRLTSVGAAKRVQGPAELGHRIEELLAPDRVAAMAHAGWTVISANAAVTNRLTGIISNVVDGIAA